jgi:hypothetical protein
MLALAIGVSIEHRLKEAPFAIERGVNAWCSQTHGRPQIGHGCAFVTVTTENIHRPIEHLPFIKRARTCHTDRLPLRN